MPLLGSWRCPGAAISAPSATGIGGPQLQIMATSYAWLRGEDDERSLFAAGWRRRSSLSSGPVRDGMVWQPQSSSSMD
jgi:hypothetical protein